MTRIEVLALSQGQLLHHAFAVNADGTPQRWRVTSVKTWKTRPEAFCLRLKRGFWEHAVVTERDALGLAAFTLPPGAPR